MALTVTFDGQDISDQIVGSVNVRREERAAGQATFIWSPDIQFTVPGPSCPRLFLDNFDNADGTLLQNHTPDVGPAWVVSQGQATIRNAAPPVPQGADFRNDVTNTYSIPLSFPTDYVLKWRFYTNILTNADALWLLDRVSVGFDGSNTFIVRGLQSTFVYNSAVITPAGGLTDVELEITVTITGSTTLVWEILEVGGSTLATGGVADTSQFDSPVLSNFFIQTTGSFLLSYTEIQNCTGVQMMQLGPAPTGLSGTPGLPYQLIRKPVQIFWNGESLFKGLVNDAIWDLHERVYQIDCSDMLQEIFEGLTPSEITGLIPGGRWSEAVFGLEEDGWAVAQDVMSTVPLDVHRDRFGAFRTVAWEAKTTADRSLTEGQILDGGAYSLDLAKGRDIITRYRVEFRHSSARWKMRLHKFSWTYTRGTSFTSFCDYIAAASDGLFPLPSKQLVITAAEGTNWGIYHDRDRFIITPPNVPGIHFTELPEGGDFCGGPIWAIDEASRQLYCTAAQWYGSRHFAQTLDEVYTFTFDAVAAQATYGIVEQTLELTAQVDSDDAGFESGDPPRLSLGGWAQDAIGDWVQDQLLEVDRVNDLECVIGRATTEMREILRGNSVSVETPIDPTIDLRHTAEITTRDIETRGKIRSIEHFIDLERALTRITIAVSTGGGGTDGDLSAPPRPDSDPVHTPPSDRTLLTTHVGGCADDDPFDEEWTGWMTNARVCDGPPGDAEQTYPLRFRVVGPDIEDEARNDFEATSDRTIEVAIPQDTLVLF